jgi:hypothetical protein
VRGKFIRQPQRIDRVDQVKELQRAADFVALQVSDEVPLGGSTTNFADFLIQLGYAVFPAATQPDGQCCPDRGDRVPLRHGYDNDLLVAARSVACAADAFLHSLEVLTQLGFVHSLELYRCMP